MSRDPSPVRLELAEALARAERMATGARRSLLGITGPPGCGKSTIAREVARHVGPRARVVGMDGFHLAQCELERLGRADRKGAPDTFDVAGYLALLQRLRERPAEPVYAPAFRRDLEEPIAGAVEVPPAVTLVVTEGNYLLTQLGAWSRVRPLLDDVWYVETPDDLRIGRLIDRHVLHGRSSEAARAWVMRSDEANARLVASTRDAADAVIPYGADPAM